jgi:hypothetical protein
MRTEGKREWKERRVTAAMVEHVRCGLCFLSRLSPRRGPPPPTAKYDTPRHYLAVVGTRRSRRGRVVGGKQGQYVAPPLCNEQRRQ